MLAADVKKFLSGGAGNTDPNLAFGGIISATEVSGVPLNSLFDNVSAVERASGITDYRCFYVKNDHGSETLSGASIHVAAQTPSPGTTVEIGLDPAGNGDGSTTGVAAVIASETAAPAGVTFTASPAGSPLAIGALAAGQCRAVWVKRIVSAGAAALASDGFTLMVTGKPPL